MSNNILNGNWKQLLLIVVLSCLTASVSAQDEPPQKKELTDEEKAKANNPLANAKAVNIQYYFRPELNEVEGGSAHTAFLRVAVPTGRVLWRLSVPLETRHVNNASTNFSSTGLGDIDIFAAYLAVTKPTFTFGLGPSAAFNTASNDALGTGRNSLGLAAVVFASPVPQIQVGGLVIWRTDIGGDDARDEVGILALQPFYIFQVGNGFYFRGAPIIPFDLESGHYHVPMGLGAGKVIKIGGTVLNFFIEPQPSVLVYGAGQPQFQIYGALNIQF